MSTYQVKLHIMNQFFQEKTFAKYFLLLGFGFFFSATSFAADNEELILADSCTYTINLYDSFGDGWNGNTIDVISGATSTSLTINSGSFATNTFTVFPGETVSLVYNQTGSWNNEVTFELLDSEGVQLYFGGPNPFDGLHYEGEVVCPDCPVVNGASITAEALIDSVYISWDASGAESYFIEYGLAGFAPGSGDLVNTTDNFMGISPLDDDTTYEFYIYGDCGADGISTVLGPFSFTTLPACPPIDGFTVFAEPFIDSVYISWEPTLAASSYVVEYGPVGFAFGTGTSVGSVDNFIGIAPIADDTEYEFYVYADCLDDGLSGVVGPYSFITFPACPEVDINSITTEVFTDSVFINWNPSLAASSYVIEYGPAGFPLGYGASVSTANTEIGISPLNSGLAYEYYLYVDCLEDGYSDTLGPISFVTDYDLSGGTGTCDYTLYLYDSFGDGWNGASLTFESGGITNTYTISSGSSATYTFTANSNSVVNISYTSGSWESEVSYVLEDEFGNVIYENGPFPPVGQNIFSFIACPTCIGPSTFDLDYTLATSAAFTWDAAVDPGYYELEVGSIAFVRGTGSVFIYEDVTEGTVDGLEENTYYSAYLTYFCDDGEVGATLGPIMFQTGWLVDVGVSGFYTPYVDTCDIEGDLVKVELENYGQLPQTLIPVKYSVNGSDPGINFPFDGYYTGVIGYNSNDGFSFNTVFDFSEPGTYIVNGWTELETDSNPTNDTFELVLSTAKIMPLVEDFEDVALPDGWTTSTFFGFYNQGAHNNSSACWGVNLYSQFNPTAQLTTDRYYPVGANDTLTFEYRYTEWFAGTNAFDIGDNQLNVQISTDCGNTFETVYVINGDNHTPNVDFTLAAVPLADFEGEAINVRFFAEWSFEDYWLDIDNVNILGCAPTFAMSPSVTGQSGHMAEDASITFSEPLFGSAPYTYVWDVDPFNNTPSIDGLGAGFYTLTVQDAYGCQEVYQVEIDEIPVNTTEIISFNKFEIMPNPTTGALLVDIEMADESDLYIELIDQMGRVLFNQTIEQVSSYNETLDLEGFASGMYFLRAYSENSASAKRVILSK